MLPYRYAHWFILALIGVAGLAFTRSYLSVLSEAPLAFHVHGISAALWMLLLAAQSWAAHNGQWTLHKTTGRSIFVLAPIFLVGNLMVIQTFDPARGPFEALFASPLAALDALAVVSFLFLIYWALKYRRTVQLHSGFMLATLLTSLAPIFVRITPAFMPGLTIRGPEDLSNFGGNYIIIQSLILLLCVYLYLRSRPYGAPWLFGFVITAAQLAIFLIVPSTNIWQPIHAAYQSTPTGLIIGAGLIVGAATVWLGWQAGKKPAPAPAQ